MAFPVSNDIGNANVYGFPVSKTWHFQCPAYAYLEAAGWRCMDVNMESAYNFFECHLGLQPKLLAGAESRSLLCFKLEYVSGLIWSDPASESRSDNP